MQIFVATICLQLHRHSVISDGKQEFLHNYFFESIDQTRT